MMKGIRKGASENTPRTEIRNYTFVDKLLSQQITQGEANKALYGTTDGFCYHVVIY